MTRSRSAIIGDVIEHVTKEEAARSVLTMLNTLDVVVLSIPVGIWEQGAAGGNPWETHVATWSIADIASFFPHQCGIAEYATGSSTSIAIVFIARKEKIRRNLTRIFSYYNNMVKKNNKLIDCGLGFGSDLKQDGPIEAFVSEILSVDFTMERANEETERAS